MTAVPHAVGGLSEERVSGSPDFNILVPGAPVRTLLTGEILFREGDAKTYLHQISAGVICVYRTRVDRPHEVIEFVFAGDVLGLGFLDHHIYCARALVETRVSCLPISARDAAVRCDHRAQQRHAEALHREFAYRKNLLITATCQKPISRLAAFLLVVSERNKQEGRDPNIITDSLKCGVVAGWLGLDIETLGRALVELEKKRLIEACEPLGLRLKDVTTLESLADNHVVGFVRSRRRPNLSPEIRIEA